MVSFHDNVISHLELGISDSDSSLTVAYDFSSYDIPSEGWLTIGNAQHRRPGNDGSPPTSESIRYTSYSFGTDTTTFSGLTRGVDNTNAQSWSAGDNVGLSITGDLLDYVANYSYAVSFGSGDLSSGILTVTHNMNISYPSVSVYDDNDPQLIILPDEIRYISTDEIEIDLSSYSVPASGWQVRIV